jgi:hypothetical protein
MNTTTPLKSYPEPLPQLISTTLLKLDTSIVKHIEITYYDWHKWMTLGYFDKGLWCTFEGITVRHSSSVRPGTFSIVFDPS